MASSIHDSTSSSSSSGKKRPSPNSDHESSHHHKRPHQADSDSRNDAVVSASSAPPLSEIEERKRSSESRIGSIQREMMLLFETEYQEDAIKYMHEMDSKTRPSVETIDVQPELQWYMRPYLIDFLIEIHQQYRLRPETLYLTVNIIDRYVSKRVVFKKHYQLVGCSALWIAAKFEDSKERVPTVAELCKMCCGAYEESSFTQMEGHVLSTIDWMLGHPTCEAWLRAYSIGAQRKGLPAPAQGGEEHRASRVLTFSNTVLESSLTGHVARFIMEISLFHRSYVNLRSCHIAAGALVLARYILGYPRRIEEESEEILAVVRLFDTHLGDHFSTISTVVMRKYSAITFSRATNIVREWYSLGYRFRAEDPISLLAESKSDALVSRSTLPTSVSAPELSEQQRRLARPNASNVSLSSSVSSSASAMDLSNPRNPYLTPSSISSLSLDSSPTSSVSSFVSSSISSPQSSILVESRKAAANGVTQQTHDEADGTMFRSFSAPKFSIRGSGDENDGNKENQRPISSVEMIRNA